MLKEMNKIKHYTLMNQSTMQPSAMSRAASYKSNNVDAHGRHLRREGSNDTANSAGYEELGRLATCKNLN